MAAISKKIEIKLTKDYGTALIEKGKINVEGQKYTLKDLLTNEELKVKNFDKFFAASEKFFGKQLGTEKKQGKLSIAFDSRKADDYQDVKAKIETALRRLQFVAIQSKGDSSSVEKYRKAFTKQKVDFNNQMIGDLIRLGHDVSAFKTKDVMRAEYENQNVKPVEDVKAAPFAKRSDNDRATLRAHIATKKELKKQADKIEAKLGKVADAIRDGKKDAKLKPLVKELDKALEKVSKESDLCKIIGSLSPEDRATLANPLVWKKVSARL